MAGKLPGTQAEAKEIQNAGDRRCSSIIAQILACAAFLLMTSPLLANDPCDHLRTAKAQELLAFPEVDTFADWIPPGVECTWEGTDRKPEACATQTTITQDRMVGDSRLIVLSSSDSSVPGSEPLDYVFAFACIDEQIKAVTHASFHSSEKADYSQYASPEQPRGAMSWGMPRDFHPRYRCPPVTIVRPEGAVLSYVPQDCDHPRPAIACDEMSTASADQLLRIPIDGWRGVGCYAESRPDRCDWQVKIRADRIISDGRRLIDVGAEFNSEGFSGCSDQIYVFGGVDGEAATVFENRFARPKKIKAEGDRLQIVLWSRNLADVISRNPNEDWEMRRTYSWSADVQNYVLRSLHYGPPPKDEKLPRTAPPCDAASMPRNVEPLL